MFGLILGYYSLLSEFLIGSYYAYDYGTLIACYILIG